MKSIHLSGKQSRAGAPKKAPELVKIPVGYKLPRWMVEWMRGQAEPQSVLIEKALVNYYCLGAPKILEQEKG